MLEGNPLTDAVSRMPVLRGSDIGTEAGTAPPAALKPPATGAGPVAAIVGVGAIPVGVVSGVVPVAGEVVLKSLPPP
jgi:hypothetical protein